MSAQQQRLRELLAPLVARSGLDLEDVSVARAGSRSVVRVIVDGDDGVDLDQVASVSREVGAALDADDEVVPGAYTLEVTSPGVDRPLTQPRHWRRARGRLVSVTRGTGAALTGRVVVADEAAATLESAGGTSRIAYADVVRAVVQVEFSRPAPQQQEAAT